MYMMRDVDYWIAGENEDVEYYAPGSNGIGAADTYSSSMNYQDGSYIKMRNISLGYNFSQRQLKKIGLNSLKVWQSRHKILYDLQEGENGWIPT